MTHTGRCLCGGVTMTAAPHKTMQACHCGMCRVWGGGPLMAVACKTASFEGPVTRYRSSAVAERGFCKVCGTHLFFHATAADVYAVPVGVFDDGDSFRFAAEIYVDEQPDTYAFDGERKRMTGAEFEALFT